MVVRKHRRLVLLLAAALAGAVGLVALGRGSGGEDEPLLTGPRVSVRTSFSRQVHLFGDPLAAEIEVVANRRDVDVRTLRFDTDFSPYRIVGPARRTRVDTGPTSEIRYTFTLSCLTAACVPERTNKRFEFHPLRVAYLLTARPGKRYVDRFADRRFQDLDWPPVEVTSRLRAGDLAEPRFRTGLRPLPAVSYRMGPHGLAMVLLAVAVLLLFAACALLWRHLRRERPRAVAEESGLPRLSALERALVLAEEAVANGKVAEERKALEALARELARSGQGKLARDARRLAWSEAKPSATSVDALCAEVRKAMPEEAR